MSLRLPASPVRRLALIIAVSLLLHVLAFGVLRITPPEDDDTPSRLSATLAPLPDKPAVKPAPPTPTPTPAPREHRRSKPQAASDTATARSDVGTPAPPLSPGSTQAPTPAPLPAAPVPPPAVPAPPPAPPIPPTDAPASARLVYKVLATDPRNDPPKMLYGDGAVTWKIDAGRYTLDLDAGVSMLFISIKVLTSHSEGALDAYGLAPVRYTETPRNKPMVATNFNRDATSPLANSISYSASSSAQPLAAGVQDKLSVLLQIGALLRANADLTQRGAHFDVPVAGTRGDFETWRFNVLGSEVVETGIGNLNAVRVQRTPRQGTNDRTIDVWLVLERGGYPAQIRYTEPNTTRIDLTLDKIE